jgi:hypothetical protein
MPAEVFKSILMSYDVNAYISVNDVSVYVNTD